MIENPIEKSYWGNQGGANFQVGLRTDLIPAPLYWLYSLYSDTTFYALLSEMNDLSGFCVGLDGQTKGQLYELQ